MLSPGGAINEDVVKEDEDIPTQEWLEDEIHQRLEHGWHIVQPKGHDQKLEMAMVGVKCRLGHVFGMDADLVVPRSEIELREESCAVELVQEFLNHGDGELILDRGRVERAVIHVEPPGGVLFLDEQLWRRERRRARLDDALLEHSLTLPLQLVIL